MEKRLTWKESDVVAEWFAYNDAEEELGWLSLENVGRHIHWCWYQNEDIRMSPGCLQEVRDKQKELSKHRSQKSSVTQRKTQEDIRKG